MTANDVLFLEQYSPADWGARVDYDSHPADATPDEFVAVHWPGVDVDYGHGLTAMRAALRGFEKYHLDQGYDGGIAYNWALDLGGDLYRLRGLARSGATSGDVDKDGVNNNRESFALLLVLGTGQLPSAAMIDACAKFFQASGLTPRGHREVSTPRACPGDPVMDHIVLPYRRGTLRHDPRSYSMLVYAEGRDAATAAGILSFRPKAVVTSNTDEARAAVKRGEPTVALGGGASRTLFPDLAAKGVGVHRSGSRTAVIGADAKQSYLWIAGVV